MRTTRPTLEAKVRAVNAVNAILGKVYDHYAPVFVPLVGQKVVKTTGELMAKVEVKLTPFDTHGKLTIYRHKTNYSLGWTVRACESVGGDHGVIYHEQTVYVCDLRDGVVEKMSDAPKEYRTDFTADEIEAQRKVCEELENRLRDEKSKLGAFGEYDR